jgi:CheY-like chemotaxis protein
LSDSGTDASTRTGEYPVVLVVDDDPLLGTVVEACLEGARVESVHSLAEARKQLRPGLAHVVLDRRLPDGDGLELLPDLAARCPDVAVVVFSAIDDAAEPAGLPRVDKSDIATLVEVIGLKPGSAANPASA